MAEPFKLQIHAGTVEAMAHHLGRADPAFRAEAFRAVALPGLDALAFKARAMRLADALEAALPEPFDAAAAAIEAALGPPGEGDDLAGLTTTADGLGGWSVWPLGEYVARRGLPHPVRALQTLQALTQRFSAEFAIRPFIAAHPEIVFTELARWVEHPSAHVRRLVSEGSRPRLPWGLQLRALVADPRPTLPMLAALQDDPSAYVRRSVANHLNDIAKDHPALVVDWLRAHLPEAPAERRALLRHACRGLIKQGHAPTLAAWGLGAPLHGRAALTVSPARIALGEAVELSLALASTAPQAQVLEVDVVVHHVKASGGTSAKVFKGWRLTLAPGEQRLLQRRHAVRPITTRRYHAGWHRVEVQVNGQSVAEAGFELTLG
jgi:3-methyladenine DNA glycosylase AlkC